MAAAPTYKVYDSANTYQAAAKTLDLAKAAAAHLGPGATVRNGHRTRHTIHTILDTPTPEPTADCHTCGTPIAPEAWGQRGDGPAEQDAETGFTFCGSQCYGQYLVEQRRAK